MNEVYAKHFEHGNTPARATIGVAWLPEGANIEFTGVAVRDLAKRQAVRPKNMSPSPTASPCVWAGDTYYCSAKSGFIPGPNGGIFADRVEDQVRQTMRNLLDGLEEAGLNFSNVVATNVYVDNLDEFAKMNAVYGPVFPQGCAAHKDHSVAAASGGAEAVSQRSVSEIGRDFDRRGALIRQRPAAATTSTSICAPLSSRAISTVVLAGRCGKYSGYTSFISRSREKSVM